jgi:hypothetical protein
LPTKEALAIEERGNLGSRPCARWKNEKKRGQSHE